MKKQIYIILSIALLSLPLHAKEYGGSGFVVSNHNGLWGGGLNLEGGVTATGTEGFGNNGYGHGHLDLTLGVPFGLNASGNYGYQVTPKDSVLHFGVEPFNVDFKLTTTRNTGEGYEDTQNYLEWLPAGSVGVLIPGEDCRVLALGRGGYALSTRGSGPLVGGALYANCNDFDVAGEFTRVLKHEGGNRDTVTVDTTIPVVMFRGGNNKLGLRAEHITDNNVKDLYGNVSNRNETRAFITGRVDW